MKRPFFFHILVLGVLFNLLGCAGGGNQGRVQSFKYYPIEADWIRNGEPIEFEAEKWYPADIVESLLDNEVYILGEYKGVPFFVEKADVRPYDRLYTKFQHNQFRLFEKRLSL